jgi:hypothetical protein
VVVFATLVALAIGVPIAVSILLSTARHRAENPAWRPRTIGMAALAGAVGVTPINLLLAMGAYADLAFLLVGWAVGAMYGAIVAGVVVRVRQ